MAHIRANKKRLIARVRRIQGQLEAVIRAVENNDDCLRILQTASACRGAFSGLFMDLLEEHIDTHLARAPTLSAAKAESKALARILRSYFK